jgi:hypothetical protein
MIATNFLTYCYNSRIKNEFASISINQKSREPTYSITFLGKEREREERGKKEREVVARNDERIP